MGKYTEEERCTIRKNMTERGGSFVRYLAMAHAHADLSNKFLLEQTFEEYFDNYLNFEDFLNGLKPKKNEI